MTGMDGFRPAPGARLEFVMFYAFRSPDPETEAQIALLARSIRASYPEASIVLLTNPVGAAAAMPGVEIAAREVHPEHIMVERLRGYRDRMRAAEPGSVLVFMDTDMLVLRRFDELLAGGADLAVTVRRDRTWPINAGLVVARKTREEGVEAFFDRLVACCEDLPEDEKRWYGDQVALARVLAPEPGRFKHAYVGTRDGLTVRFAPSRLYNQTPRPWMLRLALYRGAARILHFKGGRKARMAFYARLYLSGAFRAYVRRRYGG